MSGGGISWAICKTAPRSRQITTPAPHHSVFTGRVPFLPPNQQRQSTEGHQSTVTTMTLTLISVRDQKVCPYNRHSSGSLGWPFTLLKYKYVFQIKYTEATLSNSTRKLLGFDITRMPIAVKKINLSRYLLQLSARFRSLRRAVFKNVADVLCLQRR